MRYLKPNTLYCFSPPVMIITFAIEIAFAIYTVWRYKLTPITRLVALTLICLATFQLAEYNVCEGAFGISSLDWARVGYAAITLLPPLGIHMAVKLAGDKKRNWLVWLGYTSGVAFAIFFLLVDHGMQSQLCLGNYVIFEIAPGALPLYTAYYYGWLAVSTMYAWQQAKRVKRHSKKRALQYLAVGYMAFIVPTIAAVIINPTASAGIPSIMCGFAVILGLVLTFFVVPNFYHQKKGTHAQGTQ